MIGLAAAALLVAAQGGSAPATSASTPTVAAGTQWTFDQVRFPAPSDRAALTRILTAIQPDRTLVEVEARLTRMGIRFERSMAEVDPARLPDKMRAQIQALPPGEPIAIPDNGQVTINVLVSRSQPATPLPASVDPERLDAARALVDVILPPDEREEQFRTALDAALRAQVAGMMQGQPGLADAINRYPELGIILTRFIERQRGLSLGDLRETVPQFVNAQTQGIARRFTADELRRLAEMFAQPLARKYLHEAPKLLAEPEMAAWQRQIATRVQLRMQPELERLQDEIKAAISAQGRRPNAS